MRKEYDEFADEIIPDSAVAKIARTDDYDYGDEQDPYGQAIVNAVKSWSREECEEYLNTFDMSNYEVEFPGYPDAPGVLEAMQEAVAYLAWEYGNEKFCREHNINVTEAAHRKTAFKEPYELGNDIAQSWKDSGGVVDWQSWLDDVNRYATRASKEAGKTIEAFDGSDWKSQFAKVYSQDERLLGQLSSVIQNALDKISMDVDAPVEDYSKFHADGMSALANVVIEYLKRQFGI